MANPNPQNYNCPQCGQVDRVEKVSALLRAGTSTGFYSGTTSGSGLVAGMSYTALSQKLSPPSEPTYQSPWGCGSQALLVVLSIPILLLTIVCVIGIGYLVHPGFSRQDQWIALVVYVAITAALWFIVIAIFAHKAKMAKQRRSDLAADRTRWERAMTKWNEMYYCARNDVVFLPGKSGACVPITEMQKLLYRP